jgi:hypothetical protein
MSGSVSLSIHVPQYVIVFEKKRLKAVLRRAGAEVASIARSKIKNAAGGGVMYRGPGGSAAKYRGGYIPGAYQASSPNQAPVSVTGTLARSIKVRPFQSGEGVAIRDGMFYALFLEKGAKGGGRKSRGGVRVRGKGGIGTVRVLQPRPFLTTALESRQNSIASRIQEAVLQDIKFRRLKP